MGVPIPSDHRDSSRTNFTHNAAMGFGLSLNNHWWDCMCMQYLACYQGLTS